MEGKINSGDPVFESVLCVSILSKNLRVTVSDNFFTFIPAIISSQ